MGCSAIALYAFAASHARAISIVNRKLTFMDDSAPEFRKRFDESIALYKQFIEKTRAAIAVQKRSRAAAGMDKQ
jgi:hypothetical protein